VNVLEFADRELLAVLDADPSEAEWLAGRAEGVTGSEVHHIANGGMGTWHRILQDKLNGARFSGSVATRAGHAAEPRILDAAARVTGVAELLPTPMLLLAKPGAELHRVTPDGLGVHEVFGAFGVEVKHHMAGWGGFGVPPEHMSQCQWGLHVAGLDWWLYVTDVEGEQGVWWEWIPRDNRVIERLSVEADRFIAWRESGAPMLDDLPAEVDDAIAARVLAQRYERRARELRAESDPVIAAFVDASRVGDQTVRAVGSRGQLAATVKLTEELDEVSWAARAPKAYQAWRARRDRLAQQRARVDEIAAEAATVHHRTVQKINPVKITANKEDVD
tara:strand:+ start:273 stop:1271 length:999 start_codon:yes stop_codon:yes gene_type:complete